MCFLNFFVIFLTFYILQAGPINVSGPGQFTFYSPSRRDWVR